MKNLTPKDVSINFPVSRKYKAGFTSNQNFQVHFKTGDELLFTGNGMGSFTYQQKIFTGSNKAVFERYKESTLFKE